LRGVHYKRNQHGRKATSHQRTILYFTVFFGVVAVAVVVAVIWFVSRLHVPATPAN
jgi:hypothetical protein